MIYTGGPQVSWEFGESKNAVGLDWNGEEVFLQPMRLLVLQKPMGQTGAQRWLLLLSLKEGWLRGWGQEPHRTVPGALALNGVGPPGSRNWLGLGTSFVLCVFFLLSRIPVTGVLDLSCLCILGANPLSTFKDLYNGEEFCPWMDYTQGLPHTWFRWWSLGLLVWWDLDEIWGSSLFL